MRAIAAIVAGLLAGGVAMVAVALLGGMLYPSSATVDAYKANQIIDVFTTLPMGAKAAIILSWFAGALVGSAVAKLIARAGWAAWTIAALFALYVLLSVFILPMPGWLQAVAVAAPLIGGLIANHLVKARAPDMPDEAAATTDPVKGGDRS